jgi:hypothetical protein
MNDPKNKKYLNFLPNPEGKNPLVRLRFGVRIILKQILKVLGCGDVRLILISKNVFLGRERISLQF